MTYHLALDNQECVMQNHRGFLILAAVSLAVSAPVWGQSLTCSSDDGKRHRCDADTRQGVQLLHQRSGSPCTQGYSWGFDDRGIWVDHGCRADFGLQAPAPPNAQVTTCSSDDGGRHYCEVDTRAGVQLVRQRSGSRCVQGETWGFDGRGIWVDGGCRADFALQVGPPGRRDRDDRDDSAGLVQTLYCPSDDGERHYCEAETRAGVKMVRQRSGSPCTQGYSWGFDDRGIWVDHGCRADFALEARHRDDRDRDRDRDRDDSAGLVQTLYCPSDDGKRRYCDAETRGGVQVQMVNQRSGSPCTQGYSWGFDDRGIWVDHGCRADFALQTGPDRFSGSSCFRAVGPEQANRLVNQCLQVSPGTHPPCNATNSCALIRDEIRRGCRLLGRDAPSYCDEYR
jgi:hypothetical protein